MEWSKVESCCPLCKQRFSTISKPLQVVGVGDHSLRDVIIVVPECDQVYQPSVEELRGYLNPYEDAPCTKCHQGGEIALMLLCDLCDSAAHTYCVGLGSEVPDGNWYCVVCRPTRPVSSNDQPLPTPHHGENNNLCDGSSPIVSIRETIDHNKLYVPETPFSQETMPCASLSYSQTADSSVSGSIALTENERRIIQQQIHFIPP
ncbi:RING/U-box protein [Perilla frutescens var. hirtella]|uniref:RING/U-box protein n=1 Tax=Perilla frutescens var. hirtella TaxID=608512 RepID=A0AAD4PDY5_PERFH|nr:RING/U-box protein [Perilla frutescens var. hirtella]